MVSLEAAKPGKMGEEPYFRFPFYRSQQRANVAAPRLILIW